MVSKKTKKPVKKPANKIARSLVKEDVIAPISESILDKLQELHDEILELRGILHGMQPSKLEACQEIEVPASLQEAAQTHRKNIESAEYRHHHHNGALVPILPCGLKGVPNAR